MKNADDLISNGRGWVQRWSGHWWVRMIFAPWLISRAMLALVGALALYMIPPGTFSYNWEINGKGDIEVVQKGEWPQPKRWLVNSFSRWDSWWYYTIARYGYGYAHNRPGLENGETNLNFFPVYPMLLRPVRWFGNPPPVRYFEAGMLVSNLALLGLLTLLVKLARLDFDEKVVRGAVLALLVFPSTFYFSAVYGESIFLLEVVATFLAARRGHWWLAGLMAGLASATRAPGIVLGPALLVEYLAQRRWQWREIRFNVLWLALAPVGIASFLGYQKFCLPPGMDLTAGFQIHKRVLTWPWVAFEPFFQGTYSSVRWEGSLIDLGFTIFFLVLGGLALRLRASYGIFCLGTVLFAASSSTIASMGRYGMPCFPVFLLLGLAMRRESFAQAWIASSSMLAAFFMALFASWHYYM
jgi:hypothetical protein